MESEKFSVLISPEVISSDLISFIYTASTADGNVSQPGFVYSGMSYILSGGTNGDSLLTGLTMPILFTQTYNDIGFYSEFDGLMVQKDIVTNFLYSGTSTPIRFFMNSCIAGDSLLVVTTLIIPPIQPKILKQHYNS
jgi:hypothetical protein